MHNGRTLQSSLSKMTSQLTKVDHTLGYSASSQQRSQHSKRDDFIEDVHNFNETATSRAHNDDKSEYYRQLLQNYTKEATKIQHELLMRNEELEHENITLRNDLQQLKQNSDLTIQQLQLRLSAFELYSNELKNTQSTSTNQYQNQITSLQNELNQIKADKTHQNIETGNEAVEWIKKQVLEQNKKYELEIAELKRKLK
ncbi:Hypothetical_protein [Hexamita inflata]|uniref:Hypothetical_protein n=1 Tax=Hexamita inflata TaxID=28002 RepID=A0AA86TN62_9EUKA|nr:Hypothetical protein HINF_LOCUS11339 [Hexamita inflata]